MITYLYKRQWKRKEERSDLVLWQNPLYFEKKLKVKKQHRDATKSLDYITIADRLMSVSLSN